MTERQLHALRDRYWHLLCHRSQVSAPGDYVKLEWFDEEIVVFNDHGEILVFDNICPHRGARIFSDLGGNRRLRCDYHGWTYLRGKFHAPFPMQIEKSELERARFNTLQIQWCGDFLFAGKAPVQTLADQLAGLADTLTLLSKSIAFPYRVNAFVWESDWRIALENALEQYHTAVGLVHPNSFGKHKTDAGYDEFHGRNSIYRCAYLDPRTNRQLRALGRNFDLEYQHEGYLSIYVFPFSMVGSTFGYSYALQHFFPGTSANTCHFSSRMLTSRLRAGAKHEILESFFHATSEMNDLIFREDHAICKRVSPISLKATFRPIFAESEAKIARFRASLQAAV